MKPKLRPVYSSPLRAVLLLAFPFFLVHHLSAQQSFETGYVIDQTGRREVVDIFNLDWRFHPDTIELLRAGITTRVATEDLQEFGIGSKARYVNLPVLLEKSSVQYGHLPTDKPVPQIERTLLRVEVEGNATLYSYLQPLVTKFFVARGDGLPKQLVYTRTLVKTDKVSESRLFIKQLQAHLDCSGMGAIKESLHYNLRNIKKIVQDYNDCSGAVDQVVYENEMPGRRAVRLTVLAGLHRATLKLKDAQQAGEYAAYTTKPTLRIGLDLEFVLPFGGDKFAFLFRPNYYRIQSDTGNSGGANSAPLYADYHAVDLPFAMRYYSFLNDDVKLFLSGGMGVTLNSGNLYWNSFKTTGISRTTTLAAEVGTRYRERWNLSLGYERYFTTPTKTFQTYKSNISALRLMLGFTL